MNTAEQLYRNQKEYGDFDFDVRPRTNKGKRKTSVMTARDRKQALLLVLFAGLVCIGIILASAFGATINYTNNQLKDQNAALQGEVESLQIEIQSANNIATIEEKATTKLGMVYPKGDNLVVVSGKEEPKSNFAAILKEKAFN